jgi:hypothetical protein
VFEGRLSCPKNSTFFGQKLQRNDSLPVLLQKVATVRDVQASLLGPHGIKQYGSGLRGE